MSAAVLFGSLYFFSQLGVKIRDFQTIYNSIDYAQNIEHFIQSICSWFAQNFAE